MTSASIYVGDSNNAAAAPSSYDSVFERLTKNIPYPVLPSASPNPYDMSLGGAIADLHLHPALEAILHILNNDLPAAHFLCRHMENKPAYEAMYIHGVLHRIEGDYRNAEAWYDDAADGDAFKHVWSDHGGVESGKAFIQRVEKLRKQKTGDLQSLQQESKREIESLLDFCKSKFGTAKMADGTQAWVDKPEKNSEQAEKMLVGGEGWRQF